MRQVGWKVRPNFELPTGFELQEDADCLYLLYEGKMITAFTHHAQPFEILKFCREYVGLRG